MTSASALIEKIKNKEAKVGVIGLGYVGLPLSLRLANSGFVTLGFDIDDEIPEAIRSGRSYLKHISDEEVAAAIGHLSATTDYARVQEVDVLILCLPTPLNVHREPDLSFVTKTLESIAPYLKPGQALSLESTTYPGTTEEEVVPRVERDDINVGENFFVIYSPEREDPGNPQFSTQNIPKVVSGATPSCLSVAVALYGAIIDEVVPVRNTAVAEMTKILENIHRAVNIGLVNEMKIVADRMDIDIREVIDAAATKPFGFVPYYPGPGLGGHCIPIDPYYLTWKAREYGVNTRFIELAGEVNRSMPEYVVDKISNGLNQDQKSLNGSHILVVGIAYKKDVGDMRESPAVEIMQILSNLGAVVDYHDPFVPEFPTMRRYKFDKKSVDLNEKILGSVDAVVITTDHSATDYELIRRVSRLVVDSRGVYKDSFDGLVKA